MTENKSTPLRPTVISIPPRQKSAVPISAAAKPKSGTPTVIPGVERKRLDVKPSELLDLSPGASSRVVHAARKLLAGFAVDKVNERKAVLWGHAAQQAFATHVAGSLALAQSEPLRKAERALNRMTDILKSIDVVAAAGLGESGVSSVFRGMNSRIDTPSELEAARIELAQITDRLAASMEELLVLKENLDSHAVKRSELALEIEASALAALYLANTQSLSSPRIAERFTERAMSLTQTAAQIYANSALQDSQLEHPVRVLHAIQNVVLVAMPGLLVNFAAVAALKNKRTPMSLTEVSDMGDSLRDIINKAKT